MEKKVVFFGSVLGIFVIAFLIYGYVYSQGEVGNESGKGLSEQAIEKSFKDITCNDIIPLDKLNEVIEKEYKPIRYYDNGFLRLEAGYYDNDFGEGLTCLYGVRNNRLPLLMITAKQRGTSVQTLEQFAESQKSFSKNSDALTQTDEVGKYYFSYNDYSFGGQISQFITDSGRFMVDINVKSDEDYKDVVTINHDSGVEIAKIIHDNLESISP